MLKGIDLSAWQTDIDYMQLKASGIDFAILRCGYGKNSTQKDKMFEKHYAGCKYAGIKVGAYLYSYCTDVNNAELEAKNCLEFIKGKTFELPIFYDLEESRTAVLGRDNVTEIALIFCRVIEQAGFRAGVYANLNWFKNYIYPNKIIDAGYKIWLAQWGVNYPTAVFQFDIWQYTDNMDNTHIDGDYLINNNIMVVDNGENLGEKSAKELAVDVILGKYGNGQERKNKLGNRYNEVQDIVNELFKIIKGE